MTPSPDKLEIPEAARTEWQSLILDRCCPEPNTGCWLWMGSYGNAVQNYGRLTISGQQIRAHRASFIAWKGPIPEGLFVLHRCDNPACVNPEHLFIGTNDDNVADMVTKCRQAVGGRVNTAKLTPEQVQFVRTNVRPGDKRLGYKAIGKMFNVSRPTIASIAMGKAWRHL